MIGTPWSGGRGWFFARRWVVSVSFAEARDRACGLRVRMDLRVASYWAIRFKEDWMRAVQVVVLLVIVRTV